MFVIGTAGHVDHGKSTLVRALTGIDPDRLAEEKARGLTIDLGFAWMTLPSGREVGIVDVPGHERFVPNMLAGAGAIDMALLVVDANEGWRTQTEEHVAILDLLGVQSGVVALTKIDAATDPSSAAAEVKARLGGTVLDGAPVVPVSGVSRAGLDELVAAIDRVLGGITEPADRRRPRVFVDRAFSIKGAGTVVTGTLTGGVLRNGDEVEIAPAGRRARIRSIQTHKLSRAEAASTSRVALNLAGVDRDEIARGDAIVTPGAWLASRVIDVELAAVRGLAEPIRSRGAYVLYAGTAEVHATLQLLDEPLLSASSRAFACLRLSEPVVAQPGDRIVLRDAARSLTVAGGRVLDAHPANERISGKQIAERVARLALRASSPDEWAGDFAVAERGAMLAADLAAISGVATAPYAMKLGPTLVSRDWLTRRLLAIEDALADFHADAPLERGMPRERLRATSGIDDARLFDEVLAFMHPRVAADGPLARLADHRIALPPEQAALLAELNAAGFSPPDLKDLTARYGAPLIKVLVETGLLIRASQDVVFTPARIEEAKGRIRKTPGAFTASAIRKLLGTTRKYVIPLLEHLDAIGFTRRDGDIRSIR